MRILVMLFWVGEDIYLHVSFFYIYCA